VRNGFARTLASLEGKATPLVWLGDSTLAAMPELPSYAELAGEEIAREGLGPQVVLATFGLDFFHYYCMIGPVLELRPRAVVLVANLRMFAESGSLFLDLCTFLPASELPAAMQLPFERRGVGPARLLSYQLLGLPGGEWLLGRLYAPSAFPERGRTPDERFREWGVRLRRETPAVRMMVATLERARRAGVQVLVVASPIPYASLEELEAYRPESIELLREVAAEGGAQLLDLHRALPREELRDDDGHYTRAGAERLAAIVAERLREMLAPSGARGSEGAPRPLAAGAAKPRAYSR